MSLFRAEEHLNILFAYAVIFLLVCSSFTEQYMQNAMSFQGFSVFLEIQGYSDFEQFS